MEWNEIDNTIIDVIVVMLYRSNLSPRIGCANVIDVHRLRDSVQLTGKIPPREHTLLGHIQVNSGDNILLRGRNTCPIEDVDMAIPISDPRLFEKLLLYFDSV